MNTIDSTKSIVKLQKTSTTTTSVVVVGSDSSGTSNVSNGTGTTTGTSSSESNNNDKQLYYTQQNTCTNSSSNDIKSPKTNSINSVRNNTTTVTVTVDDESNSTVDDESNSTVDIVQDALQKVTLKKQQQQLPSHQPPQQQQQQKQTQSQSSNNLVVVGAMTIHGPGRVGQQQEQQEQRQTNSRNDVDHHDDEENTELSFKSYTETPIEAMLTNVQQEQQNHHHHHNNNNIDQQQHTTCTTTITNDNDYTSNRLNYSIIEAELVTMTTTSLSCNNATTIRRRERTTTGNNTTNSNNTTVVEHAIVQPAEIVYAEIMDEQLYNRIRLEQQQNDTNNNNNNNEQGSEQEHKPIKQQQNRRQIVHIGIGCCLFVMTVIVVIGTFVRNEINDFFTANRNRHQSLSSLTTPVPTSTPMVLPSSFKKVFHPYDINTYTTITKHAIKIVPELNCSQITSTSTSNTNKTDADATTRNNTILFQITCGPYHHDDNNIYPTIGTTSLIRLDGNQFVNCIQSDNYNNNNNNTLDCTIDISQEQRTSYGVFFTCGTNDNSSSISSSNNTTYSSVTFQPITIVGSCTVRPIIKVGYIRVCSIYGESEILKRVNHTSNQCTSTTILDSSTSLSSKATVTSSSDGGSWNYCQNTIHNNWTGIGMSTTNNKSLSNNGASTTTILMNEMTVYDDYRNSNTFNKTQCEGLITTTRFDPSLLLGGINLINF